MSYHPIRSERFFVDSFSLHSNRLVEEALEISVKPPFLATDQILALMTFPLLVAVNPSPTLTPYVLLIAVMTWCPNNSP